MRVDPPGAQLRERFRSPRIVVGIIYETGSIYLTSAAGIINVPGNVIYGCLQDVSSSSQQLFPDEGRATIGALTFKAVDIDGAISEAIREQLLVLGRGVRNNEVRVFTGDGDDFNQYVRVDTYVIDDVVELDQTVYSFSCSDRNRELREEVFQQVGTRLTATLNTTDTTVNVQNTGGFSLVQHTAAFEDGPSALVGYIRIRKTGEVIRWTGKTPTTFTGCTREHFRTIADVVVVDPATDPDKQPEVEEFIYLQMPGPQLIYAVMTGVILGTSNTLPDPWHLGIDPANVDTAAFQGIGTDLYDPANPAAGLVLQFPFLQQTDGKRFIEEQIHRVILTYSPVDTLGRLTLKRMAALISTAQPVATITYDNIISHGAIQHVQSKVINEIVFDWNFDGEEYTRTDVLFNANSINAYGRGTRVSMELGGVNASIHGRATLQHVMDSYTDRYGAPPIKLSAQVSSSLSHLEIGDCVRVQLSLVPDFSNSATIDRVFEIQGRSINWVTGEVSLDLFASTSRTNPDSGAGTSSYLPDSWFLSEGTALSAALTMTGDHVVASGSLTGGDDLRTAVFYHDGDVIIDTGVTVSISDNVQIRCTGELRVLGKIDGKGRGIAPIADPNVVGTPIDSSSFANTAQTIGSTNASAGIKFDTSLNTWYPYTSPFVSGPAAISRFNLIVASGALTNIPSELRGTRGIYAVGVVDGPTGSDIVRALGGAGGAGGAGLMIAGRGLSFGLAGLIDLSGADGQTPAGTTTLHGHSVYGGAGGGGSSGNLLVVVDGDQVTFPDLDGTFVGNHGATPATGTPITRVPPDSVSEPWRGGIYDGLGTANNAAACSIIQYTAIDTEFGETDDEVLPAPTDLAAAGDGNGLVLTWSPPAADKYDYVEIWEAISNDRTGALRIAQVRGDHYSKTSGTSITRYYWARSVRAGFGTSAWEPSGVSAGVSATFGGATGSDTVFYYIKPTTGTALKNSASTLTVEAHKLTGGTDILLSSGTIKLYVGSTEVTVGNGYGVGSDGYTGVFDAGDIGGDVIVLLKDGAGGNVIDSITLVDVLDGSASADATYGYVEPEGPLAWTRASDQTTWTPSALTVDLNCTFTRGGSDVARVAQRVTRDADGILSSSSTTHPSGNLNASDVTVSSLGGGSQSMAVKFDYDDGAAHIASVTETVLTSMAGIDGTDGIPGADSGGLITNAGFETGTLLPGWATSGSQATVINDPAKAHSGSWSVHISTGSTGLRTAPTYRPAVQVGQTLVVSCWAARDGSSLPDADGDLSVQWEDASGTVISTSSVVSAQHSISGYQGLRIAARAPPSATHAVVQFKKSGGSTGQWYADDFALTIAGESGIEEIRDDFIYGTTADFLAAWNDLSDGAGELSLLTGLTDAPGGTAIRIGNNTGNDQRRMSKETPTPYDGKSIYEVGFIARRGLGSGAFWFGLEGLAADGLTVIDTSGGTTHSAHWVAAGNLALGSSWQLIRGYAYGWSAGPGGTHNDSSAPGTLYNGIAYIRPIFVANYNGVAGQTDIAAIWVRRLTGALQGKDQVDTPEIVDGAVSETTVTTTGSLSITNTQHTPEGQSFNTLILSQTVTPAAACTIKVRVSCWVQYNMTSAHSFADFQYSLQQGSVYDGFQEQHWFLPNPGASDSFGINITHERTFSGSAGVATTLKFMGAQFNLDDSVSIQNAEMNVKMDYK